jgi:hypothetical protein
MFNIENGEIVIRVKNSKIIVIMSLGIPLDGMFKLSEWFAIDSDLNRHIFINELVNIIFTQLLLQLLHYIFILSQ